MPQVRKKGPTIKDAPDPIDTLVATRLKQRRTYLGLSQPELAKRMGISFQQIQKYERAENRISASRLYKAARVLDVDVNWFFDMDARPVTKPETMPRDEQRILEAFRRLEDEQRKQALTIVRTLAA
jgi:transcriptional regulator with XRE-family HTH domain